MSALVRVRHVTTGAEKDVAAGVVPSLSPRWSVVDPQPERPAPSKRERKSAADYAAEAAEAAAKAEAEAEAKRKKRPAKKAGDTRPAVEPDNDSQEG